MAYFEQMADREQARNWGAMDTTAAWVCTERDVWHANPFYAGPEMPHPEDDNAHERIEEVGIEAWRAEVRAFRTAPPKPCQGWSDAGDDPVIPF